MTNKAAIELIPKIFEFAMQHLPEMQKTIQDLAEMESPSFDKASVDELGGHLSQEFERQVAEFCENGAKAVTWELTQHRVTREFFATHTVRELEQASDY